MIPEGVIANFKILQRAADNGDLALLECKDAVTKEPRYVIGAMQREKDGGASFIPFGHMVGDRNPFEAYTPPEPAHAQRTS